MAFSSTMNGAGGTLSDVLIVGAGPSGLMSACLLSRYNIPFRIIDKTSTIPNAGTTDCLQSRTLEVLASMGLYHDLEKKGCKIREYTFWARNSSTGNLDMTNIGPDVMNDTPFPWTLAVDKGDIQRTLVEDLHRRGHMVLYGYELLFLSRPPNGQQMAAQIRNHNTGAIETWRTSYVLGCDGAESLVRQLLDIEVDEYGHVNHWAIADVCATTDIPDYRRRCTIRSAQGVCILTPRKASDFRIRIRLSEADLKLPTWNLANIGSVENSPESHAASSMGMVSAIQARVTEAIAPFKFTLHSVSWISRYALRKTLARSFVDPTLSVFLLGSASHTHSPLVKGAINGGMMDAVNMTWKLAYVLHRGARRSILSSYESERRTILVQALEFDCKLDQAFSFDSDDPEAFEGFKNYEDASGYLSGCGIRYPASDLIKEERRLYIRKAPEPLMPGKRLLPGKLVRHLDGNDVNTIQVLSPNGHFALVYFAGNCLDMPIIRGSSNFLLSADSPLKSHYSGARGHRESPLDIIMIHTVHHMLRPIQSLPQPWPQYPMNIFEDVGGSYHVSVGLSPNLGGLCLVRPDGYLAIVSNLDNGAAATEYLRNIQKVRPDENMEVS